MQLTMPRIEEVVHCIWSMRRAERLRWRDTFHSLSVEYRKMKLSACRRPHTPP